MLRKRLHLGDSSSFTSEAEGGDNAEEVTTQRKASLEAHKRASVPISLDTITKGEAANVLSRLFHGAARNFSGKMKTAQRIEVQAAKAFKKAESSRVKVGPLAM